MLIRSSLIRFGGCRVSVYERIRVMITVKAYPVLSTRYSETVCVAGIRLDSPAPEHVRLFPVPFRDLDAAVQFSKYDIVEVDVRRHAEDRRPESLRPNLQTLQVVDHITTKGGWAERARHVRPLVQPSMCAIRRQGEVEGGPSLAVFRPAEILDFRLRPAGERSRGQDWIAQQINLFDPDRRKLDALPYRFCYKYRCQDTGCRTHEMGLIDWEAGQSYLNFKARYPAHRLPEVLRQKWFDEIAGPTRDPHLFVGNMHRYPKNWMLLGVFYPLKGVMEQPVQDTLF